MEWSGRFLGRRSIRQDCRGGPPVSARLVTTKFSLLQSTSEVFDLKPTSVESEPSPERQ